MLPQNNKTETNVSFPNIRQHLVFWMPLSIQVLTFLTAPLAARTNRQSLDVLFVCWCLAAVRSSLIHDHTSRFSPELVRTTTSRPRTERRPPSHPITSQPHPSFQFSLRFTLSHSVGPCRPHLLLLLSCFPTALSAVSRRHTQVHGTMTRLLSRPMNMSE